MNPLKWRPKLGFSVALNITLILLMYVAIYKLIIISDLMEKHNKKITKEDNNEKSHTRVNIKNLDKQYKWQRNQGYKYNPGYFFGKMDPIWPCIFGENGIGTRGDGFKWSCGLHLIKEPCIVYSLGSANNYQFEEALLDINPKCQIFTFDPTIEPKIPVKLQDKLTFYKWGIGMISSIYLSVNIHYICMHVCL